METEPILYLVGGIIGLFFGMIFLGTTVMFYRELGLADVLRSGILEWGVIFLGCGIYCLVRYVQAKNEEEK